MNKIRGKTTSLAHGYKMEEVEEVMQMYKHEEMDKHRHLELEVEALEACLEEVEVEHLWGHMEMDKHQDKDMDKEVEVMDFGDQVEEEEVEEVEQVYKLKEMAKQQDLAMVMEVVLEMVDMVWLERCQNFL